MVYAPGALHRSTWKARGVAARLRLDHPLLSGMIDPARVRTFLDVTGYWNPSLAFVCLSTP